MAPKRKITTGTNDRPKEETISQSGEGLPDDLSRPVEADERTINGARKSLRENPRERLKREVKEEIESSEKGAE